MPRKTSKIQLAAIGCSLLYLFWDTLFPSSKNSDTTGLLNPTTMAGTNRGLRNNNPLNLRFSSVAWQGKIPKSKNTDKGQEFEQFESMDLGIRAGIQNAITAVKKHKADTLRKLIYRWAPPTENNSAEYVATVSKKAGISPDYKIDLSNTFTMCAIIHAMIQVECGADQVAKAGITRDTVANVMERYAMLPKTWPVA